VKNLRYYRVRGASTNLAAQIIVAVGGQIRIGFDYGGRHRYSLLAKEESI